MSLSINVSIPTPVPPTLILAKFVCRTWHGTYGHSAWRRVAPLSRLARRLPRSRRQTEPLATLSAAYVRCSRPFGAGASVEDTRSATATAAAVAPSVAPRQAPAHRGGVGPARCWRSTRSSRWRSATHQHHCYAQQPRPLRRLPHLRRQAEPLATPLAAYRRGAAARWRGCVTLMMRRPPLRRRRQ